MLLRGDLTTSLALQIGHRLSYDLDFFGQRPFEAQEILDEIHPLGTVQILTQSRNVLVVSILDIKVDFINYRYPTIHPTIGIDGVRLYSIPDIAAMKLAAIAGRGRKRDFYDLYFLLRQYSLKDLMAFYLKKYDDGSEWMVTRSLTFFDDADQDGPIVLLHEKIDWSEVKEKIRGEVKSVYL